VSDAAPEHAAPPGHPGFTFGPSALVTPANAITVARLLAAPIYVLMLVAWGASWVNVVVGFVLAASDGLDGYLARRHGTTRSGAFLDPLADKAVVLGALITLAAQGHLPWLPVVLITLREVGMQGYRSWVGRRGVSIPARNTAKLKTLVQDFAVGTCIIPPLAHQHTLQVAMIWFACALTLYTGAEYLLDGRRALRPRATPAP
jgi:CDP-diacylglycerol---glycerol-3-phosphate 3-phosphatidyltransferase